MLQTRTFHFYAAHRNKSIGGKCASLHGHKYDVEFSFHAGELPPSVPYAVALVKTRQAAEELGCLFEEVDEMVKQVHEKFDHLCLVNENDASLWNWLRAEDQKTYVVNGPTSVENVALCLMHELQRAMSPKYVVESVTLKETSKDSITVDRNDFEKERGLLGI